MVAPARTNDPSVQIELTRSPEWQSFQRRYGDWSAEWNEATRTPHRAVGRGIELAGFANDASSVDLSVRRFVGENPSVFGNAPDLKLSSARLGKDIWYVSYQQTYRGIPILFSDWEFRVSRSGKLVAFGADYQALDVDVAVAPRLHPREAGLSAQRGLAFDALRDHADVGQQLYILPYHTGHGTQYRLVYDVRVRTSEPRGNWITLVDAVSGDVLWRQNRVSHAIQGTSSGPVHMGLPEHPTTTRPFANMDINVGGTVVQTDSSGSYSATAGGSVTVSAQMEGPYARILRLDGGAEASFSQGNVTDPSTVNINWGSGATDGERDAFYHINWAHDHIKAIDPSNTAVDFQITAYVNDEIDDCSAFWDGADMFFTAESPLCPNTATMGDIVYHEYQHASQHAIYFAQGSPLGVVNAALSEGMADITAAFITDDPVIGEGFDGPGTFLRNLATDLVWPQDATPSSHTTGRILSGALWDLREATRLSLADSLRHFAMYGIPDDPFNAGQAMNEFFIEVLIADDDDANLSNGTPNFDNIVMSFNAHGIGTTFFLNISHTQLDDQPTFGPFPIAAVFQYTGPIGELDGNSPTLFYSMNGGPFLSELMFPTGNPDEWGGQVPQVSGAIVSYYLRCGDSYGSFITDPAGAPASTHKFVAGPASPVLFADMESNPGWTVGAAGDDATSGIWLLDDPLGTQAQPADDHTPQPGIMCYFTGNADSTLFPGANDVDGGKTTLTTVAFDATGGGAFSSPVISYYRWFSNNTGDAPNEDPWQVDISNDGGSSWTPVEFTTESTLRWERIVFFIESFIAPTNDMKLRFIASDTINPSLVEAGVDDFSMLAFPSFVDVSGPPSAGAVALAPPAPNPFTRTTTLHYTLSTRANVNLSVFDVHGRMIRKLVRDHQSAGRHSIEWDGKDSIGRKVASGPYFVRLSQNGREATQAVVRIQ